MNFNLNKLFPFLSIRKKLIIAFSMLSFIPLLVIGIIGVYNNYKSMKDIALENLIHDLSILEEKAGNFLSNVNLDIQFLSDSPIFKKYIKSMNENNSEEIQRLYDLLVEEFLIFAKTKEVYYQLHFIDKNRSERFRIQNLESGLQIIPIDHFESGHYSYYFFLTESIPQNQIAFVPVELINKNKRKIPAISYALRIYDQENEFAGIFIADIFAKDLLKILEDASPSDKYKEIAIVSNEGHYLYHSTKKNDWNKLLATRESENLFKDYPVDLAEVILSGKTGIISNSHNKIAAYTPLFTAQFPGGNSYFAFKSVDKAYLLGPVRNFAGILIGLLIIFLGISILFGYLATSQLAGPIRKLQSGAEIIAQGNYLHRLQIETNDEIEQLAHQFNLMADAINEREKLLEGHQKQLEEMVLSRTQELKSEKEKLQAILDNVPSGFLLLDENCQILSASAAIKNICGLDNKKVLGKKCFEIFPNNSFCKNCPIQGDKKLAEISTFIETEINPHGEQIYIEHISIPLKLNGHHQSFLEILTDISERKKIEENLLKTEKFAATGEMAAVIAHEMRNSLTSVKMILQLQRESKISKDDLSSLEVAIRSIYHMEEIVNNLLRFARPTPFEFNIENINQVIEESLLFVQPQFEKKKIIIRKKLQANLQDFYLDISHMKETFINIFLNSLQAIQYKGEIIIHSSLFRLPKTIEDYAYSKDNHGGAEGRGYKIIIKERTTAVRIDIKDNGIGIPKNNLTKIFDPFFTTKLDGTGLGLAMAKRIINQHGGIIQVESESNEGTTFSIILPIQNKI
jgi:PAS domain S-box-containing protein